MQHLLLTVLLSVIPASEQPTVPAEPAAIAAIAVPKDLESCITLRPEGIVVDVFSKSELDAPEFSASAGGDGGKWFPSHKPAKLKDGRFQYRAATWFPAVVSKVTMRIKHDSDECLVDICVPAYDVRVKAQCEAPRILRLPIDAGLAVINRFRVARGLAPIKYDPEFARVSRVNNEMGGVHRYNTGMQTWASPADPEAAVGMWMGPYWSSHGVIIMSPSITRGGTHSHPVYGTTFTGG